jgi:hypothetical protein
MAPMADGGGSVLTHVEKGGFYGRLKAVEVIAWAPS